MLRCKFRLDIDIRESPRLQVGKAGVGISGDSQKLMRDYGVACGGLVDLADMANERLEPGLVQRWSLAGLMLVVRSHETA